MERAGRDGRPAHTAMYRDLRGRQRSAGTFASERQANRAWQRAEAALASGRMADPRRGRQTVRAYVTGYTDSTGPEAHNLTLSRRRALVVARYLQEQRLVALDDQGSVGHAGTTFRRDA